MSCRYVVRVCLWWGGHGGILAFRPGQPFRVSFVPQENTGPLCSLIMHNNIKNQFCLHFTTNEKHSK